jgi:DUF4097 and DUF4098 domain-containing protein YvlB
MTEGAGLRVLQKNGEVRISGVPDSHQVKLTASSLTRPDVADYISVTEDQGVMTVEVKAGSGLAWVLGGGPSIKLDLEVPVGTACTVDSGSGPVEIRSTAAAVQIDTGSGPVKVLNVGTARIETGSGPVHGHNISGAVSAETGSGDMDFGNVNGTVSLETGSGPVTVRQVRGAVRLETGSGSLVVEDLLGSAELETGSGGVRISGVRGGNLTVDNGGGPVQLRAIDVAELEVETGSGGVEVELVRVHPGGTYGVASGSGGVSVTLPPTADVTVYAEASSGRVAWSGLDLRVKHEERGELEAVLNGGQAQLRVEAGSGGIRLGPLSGAHLAPPQAPVLTPAGAQVMGAVKGDPALETSDQLRRIVQMVEQGKLTPQEAEELLRALDEEETA